MVTLEIIMTVPQVYKACRIYDHRGVIIVRGKDGRLSANCIVYINGQFFFF